MKRLLKCPKKPGPGRRAGEAGETGEPHPGGTTQREGRATQRGSAFKRLFINKGNLLLFKERGASTQKRPLSASFLLISVSIVVVDSLIISLCQDVHSDMYRRSGFVRR